MFQIKTINIQNFRSIDFQTINFWKNKTVLVWKNSSWKTVILKAIEKLLNSKKIKRKDFLNKNKKLMIEAIIVNKGKEVSIKIESTFNEEKQEANTKKINFNNEIEKIIEQINVIYIPSDRKINKDNKENWYMKLIDLILKNKEINQKKSIYTKKEVKKLNKKSWRKKTTLLITLLRLYLYSINNKNNKDFTVFIIDQPENFLHPHATKMIDSILQQIWELENTQIFYCTHSPELVSNFRKWKYEISDILFVKNEWWITKTQKIDNRYWRFNKIMINLIFKNASIFFSDAVILVEWETEKISIPNIYENINWNNYSKINKKNISKEEKINYFNLNHKNISVIDVWWKWALYEWYVFACELFWRENVIALIDRDENFYIDRDMIIKSIRKIYKTWPIYENDFKKYNWIVLNWEFENYYKIDSIKTYITEVITSRAEKFWEDFDQEKFDLSLSKLNSRLKKLTQSKKISSEYERLFNSYFRKYSKPTIAFNLSTWLAQNNWYDEELLKIFANMIEKFDKNESKNKK